MRQPTGARGQTLWGQLESRLFSSSISFSSASRVSNSNGSSEQVESSFPYPLVL